MAARSVLISGAGVAGTTLAYWLAAAGDEVTVVEKSAGQHSSGNPVDVRGDAVRVARAMGIWPALEAAWTGVDTVSFVASDGRPVATMATQSHRARRLGGEALTALEIGRAELVGILRDAVRERARYVAGDTVTALHDDGATVKVEFERMPPSRFDLVIGADGLHSGIRRLVFGRESAFARPFGMFIATVRTRVELANPKTVLVRNEPGRSLAVHPAGGHPGFAFIFRSRAKWDGQLDSGRALVERLYLHDNWLAPEALTALKESPEVYFDGVTRIEMEHWHRGRVALLGDAASCLSIFGEGSSNALAGAKTLADALAAHPGDPAAAFAAYERAQRRRVTAATRGAGLAAHFLVPASRPGVTARNAMCRAFGKLGLVP